MRRRARVGLIVVVGLILLFVVYESIRPRSIDYSFSYLSEDKIPYGTYVLYESLPDLFPDATVEINASAMMDKSGQLKEQDNIDYMIVNDYVELNASQSELLMKMAENGGRVLIAAEWMSGKLFDSLKVTTGTGSDYYWEVEDKVKEMKLVNPSLPDEWYEYGRDVYHSAFISFDTLNTKVLGKFRATQTPRDLIYGEEYIQENNNYEIYDEVHQSDDDAGTYEAPEELVNYIEVPFGEGSFLLHTSPIAFTNYYLLEQNNQEYVAGALSYLNGDRVLYDNYIKTGRSVSSSPLRYLLSQPALKWAWYLTLLTILLYMLFTAKRRQRPIPIVRPLENASVAFTQTISQMYLQSGDYGDIADKKINYFLAYVRQHYFLDTSQLDKRFAERLSKKSGIAFAKAKILIQLINNLRNQRYVTEEQLRELHAATEIFYKR